MRVSAANPSTPERLGSLYPASHELLAVLLSRPISWLPRLHVTRRSVANSMRSHYDRHDLQQLFELQPRAAQNFFAMLPSVSVGRSLLVEREALIQFLDGVQEAENVPAYLETVRAQRAVRSRKAIRALVRTDLATPTATSLPECLTLAPGRLEIEFRTVEQMVEALYALARLLEADEEEFIRAYTPQTAELEDSSRDDVQEMFRDLELLETSRAKAMSP